MMLVQSVLPDKYIILQSLVFCNHLLTLEVAVEHMLQQITKKNEKKKKERNHKVGQLCHLLSVDLRVNRSTDWSPAGRVGWLSSDDPTITVRSLWASARAGG